LASASKRRQATCIPAVIDVAALAGEVVRVALMIVPAESEIMRPEYAPTVKREKSAGRSTATAISGEIVTWEMSQHFSSANIYCTYLSGWLRRGW